MYPESTTFVNLRPFYALYFYYFYSWYFCVLKKSIYLSNYLSTYLSI